MQVIQAIQPGVYDEVRPVHIVFGAYEGEIPAGPDERVLFMGDCAQYQGEICGKPVEIPFLYRYRHTLNPHRATSGDLLAKILGYLVQRVRVGRQQVIRVKGCPVSVAENIFWIGDLGRTKIPYLDPDIVFKFAYHYIVLQLSRFWGQRVRPRLSSVGR
jgi:hypothetical protein